MRDGRDRSDEGVCRHDDLVATCHHAEGHVGLEYDVDGIESVANADAELGADEGSVFLLEAEERLTPDIPSGVNDPGDSRLDLLIVEGVDFMQVEKRNCHE